MLGRCRHNRGWLGYSSSGLGGDEVAVYRGSWREKASKIGPRYPVGARATWVFDYGMWLPAQNMALTIVFRRADLRVISVQVSMIFL